MAKVHFYGNDAATTKYSCGSFSAFIEWANAQESFGFDTETNVTESILERKLKVLAYSNKTEDIIWILQWEFLTPQQQYELFQATRLKLHIIHNASFDYQVMKKHGLVIEKIWDTMLVESILSNGLSADSGSTGLQAVYYKRFQIDISKAAQLTYGDTDTYSDGQIEYAAVDTLRLHSLYRIQRTEMAYFDKELGMDNKGLLKTAWWENEFVKVVGDMESNGVRLHKDKWYAISDKVIPIYERELATLNKLVLKYFKELLVNNNWYSDEDEFITPVWSSSAKKKAILEEYYDFEVEKTAVTELKKLLKEHDPDFPSGLPLNGRKWNESEYPYQLNNKFAVLKLMILNTKGSMEEHLNAFLMENMREFCIEQSWIRPGGKVAINWGSPKQRLTIFQAISPEIESTGKDVIIDYETLNPIIPHYLQWSDVEYQLKNFGKAFYDKHVELDGKHRTRFQQILKTGRLSSVKPNLLNIPRKHGGVYREAIIPDPGFEMLNADYDGQELIIVAILAGEESWLRYLSKGYDLHSKNAELIFGKEWEDATEDGCKYYAKGVTPEGELFEEPAYKKCSCKGHMEMRDASKAVSFGSIYGISYFKLAFNLKISEERAKFILEKFFEIVPAIRKMMDRFGQFALSNEYIVEPVFGRIRFFDKWRFAIGSERNSIMRAAFNTPIQSSGSSILKIAFVLMRRWINHSNLNEHIHLLLPYHDETIAQARTTEDRYYIELGKEKVQHYMMLAARLAGFNINAEAKAGLSWAEAH